MELLLEKGATIDNPTGWPLQVAAKRGHTNVIEKLLARGANINALTTNENFPQGTALQAACEFGQSDVVRMLLEHGADPNLRPNESTCPLIAATLNGDENATRLLLDNKSEVNVHGGRYNATPLINAASWLPTEFVKLILQAGANIDDDDEDGDTALISAARRGDADCIKLLLDHGADFMHTNHDGQNALQVAILNSNANEECAKILIDTMSNILMSIKAAMDTGNEAVASVVRAANVERLEAARTKDVASQPALESVDTKIKPEDQESQLSTSESHQSMPTPVEAAANDQSLVTRKPAPVDPPMTLQASDYGNNQSNVFSNISSDYKTEDSSVQSQPPGNQRSNANPTSHYNGEDHQPYNPISNMAQQPQATSTSNGWPQSQYSNQPQLSTTFEPQSYLPNSNSNNQWGADNAYSQNAPAYQPYRPGQESYTSNQYNQGVPDQWQQQQQAPPIRPGSDDRKSSSSSLFGRDMKDSFEKAKQFGLNRWRS